MRSVAIGIVALLSACTARGDNSSNDANVANGAKAANEANLAVPDCPTEELSCGRQRPVRSDGVTRFRNEDMYLSAVFPAGDQVCMTRSGDTPRGFFAVYDAPPACPEPPQRSPRFIVLHSMFNATFHADVEDAPDGACAPVTAGTRRRLGGTTLAMPGFRAVLCEAPRDGGATEISLHFLGGPWQEGEMPGSRVRAVIYYFSFGTTPDHFDEDLARFRRVLASVRIATRDQVQRVP